MKRTPTSPLAATLLTLSTLLLTLVYTPRPALACSMCRCGDATFNALGTQVFGSESAFRVALDWERFDKENALPTEEHPEGGHERQVEQRETLTLAYSVGARLNLMARLPFSQRELTTYSGDKTEREDASGMADPELAVQWQLWAAPFSGGMGSRSWVSVMAGVKTSWGENDLTSGAERLEEHLQPGTGSTDWTVGLSGVHLASHTSSLFGSLAYRHTGTNDHGYRYGSTWLATFGYERHLSTRLDGVLELDWRDAESDVVDDSGEVDPNSGGRVLYVAPRLLVDLGKDVVLRAGAQIPVADSLHGDQTEHTVYNLGLTFLL